MTTQEVSLEYNPPYGRSDLPSSAVRSRCGVAPRTLAWVRRSLLVASLCSAHGSFDKDIVFEVQTALNYLYEVKLNDPEAHNVALLQLPSNVPC